jgi:thiol-disulfide isomerase/thioredoxin
LSFRRPGHRAAAAVLFSASLIGSGVLAMVWRWGWIGAACLLVAGCETNISVSSGGGESAPPSETAEVKPAAAALKPEEIALEIGDGKALEAMIEAQKGKVVFVDCWATWCGPCVEYFPHTVEMHNKYKDQGYATIAVSFDELAAEPEVRKFLADQGADFLHVLSKYDGVSTEAAEDFDVGPLPEFRLYDRTGKLRKKWEGKPDDVEEQIEALLAEEA